MLTFYALQEELVSVFGEVKMFYALSRKRIAVSSSIDFIKVKDPLYKSRSLENILVICYSLTF